MNMRILRDPRRARVKGKGESVKLSFRFFAMETGQGDRHAALRISERAYEVNGQDSGETSAKWEKRKKTPPVGHWSE